MTQSHTELTFGVSLDPEGPIGLEGIYHPTSLNPNSKRLQSTAKAMGKQIKKLLFLFFFFSDEYLSFCYTLGCFLEVEYLSIWSPINGMGKTRERPPSPKTAGGAEAPTLWSFGRPRKRRCQVGPKGLCCVFFFFFCFVLFFGFCAVFVFLFFGGGSCFSCFFPVILGGDLLDGLAVDCRSPSEVGRVGEAQG